MTSKNKLRSVILPGFRMETAILYLILSAVVQFPVLGLKQARKSTRMPASGDKIIIRGER